MLLDSGASSKCSSRIHKNFSYYIVNANYTIRVYARYIIRNKYIVVIFFVRI